MQSKPLTRSVTSACVDEVPPCQLPYARCWRPLGPEHQLPRESAGGALEIGTGSTRSVISTLCLGRRFVGRSWCRYGTTCMIQGESDRLVTRLHRDLLRKDALFGRRRWGRVDLDHRLRHAERGKPFPQTGFVMCRVLARSSLSSESSFPIGFGRMRTNGRGGPVYTLMSRSRSRACCCLALGVVALWKVGASGPALGRRHVLRTISPR